MSEVVERVMRAIAEEQHLSWLYDEKACSLCDQSKLDITREHLRRAAVAAIEAMREPTGRLAEYTALGLGA